MSKEIKYKADTPFSVLVDAYPPTSEVCASAQNWNKKYLKKTLGELADTLTTNAKYEPSWGIWLLYKFGVEIDIAVRKKLILAIKDSMMAFVVYLTFSWLTSEEDKLLEEKFKGKLPTAEAELEKGIVTRAKWQ